MIETPVIKSKNISINEGIAEWYQHGIKALNVNTYCFESASGIVNNEMGLGCHIIMVDDDMPTIKDEVELVKKICQESNFKDRVLYILYRIDANYPFGVVVRDF